jgi:PAS domain S-box-containing protein
MALIDKLNPTFFLIDCSGTIIYCSKSAHDLLGYSPEELLGLDFRSILDYDQNNPSLHLKTILNQPHKSFQKLDFDHYKFLHKENGLVYARGTLQSLLLEEPSSIFIISFTDISEEVKLNEVIKRLNNKLDLIASLFSHEIRGSVATILGLSNIFNYSTPLDPINNEVISRISTPLRKLDESISRIVALSSECEHLFGDYSNDEVGNG